MGKRGGREEGELSATNAQKKLACGAKA